MWIWNINLFIYLRYLFFTCIPIKSREMFCPAVKWVSTFLLKVCRIFLFIIFFLSVWTMKRTWRSAACRLISSSWPPMPPLVASYGSEKPEIFLPVLISFAPLTGNRWLRICGQSQKRQIGIDLIPSWVGAKFRHKHSRIHLFCNGIQIKLINLQQSFICCSSTKLFIIHIPNKY